MVQSDRKKNGTEREEGKWYRARGRKMVQSERKKNGTER
jgi:hypothetical protein